MKYSELKRKFSHKYIIRVMAGVLTVALLGTGGGIYSVNAAKNAAVEETDTQEDAQEEIKSAIKDILGGSSEEKTVGKEETVYLIADEKGEVRETIVSDWLKNPDKSDTLSDASDLEGIENVKGDEAFEKSGDTMTWQAGGNDIYYQGTTKKEAPVSEKITYYLDGEEIEPKELAGKSGKVTIRFDYTNNEKTTKTVDGEDYEVYVPFTVVTGMILGDNFSNLNVTNGKVISDGKNNVVVGMAMPGLKESLNVEEEDFEEETNFPDYVEVTADVEDFSLDMTITLATSEILGTINANGEFDLSALDDMIDEMTDASGQLMDGSGELAEGLDTLKESMGTFSQGVSDLKNGIKDYTDGTKTLGLGIKTLSDGSASLVDGANTLNSSAKTISDGIAKLDKTLKKKFSEKEKNALLKQVDATIDAQKAAIQKSASGSVDAQAGAIRNQAQAAVDAQAAAIKGQAEAAVDAQAETIKQQAKAAVDNMFGDAGDENSYYNNIKKQAQEQVSEKLGGMSGTISDGVTEYTRQVAQGIYTQVVTSQVVEQIKQAVMATGVDEATAAAQALQMAQTEPYVSQIQNAVSGYVSQTMSDSAITGGINTMTGNLMGGMSQVAGEVGTAVADAAKSGAEGAAQEAAVTGARSAAGSAAIAGAKAAAGEAAVTAARQAAGQAAYEGAKTAAGQAAITAAEEAKQTVAEGIEAKDKESGYSLVTGSAALAKGTGDLVGAIPTLTGGISQLLTGANTLVSNNETLNNGAAKLADGTGQITEGVDKLESGSNELADGMEEFNEKAIQKLADTYQGDVKSLLDRMEAYAMAGEDYTTFSQVAEGINGSVKFILKTDAVKAE